MWEGGDAIWDYEMLILRQCSWCVALRPDCLGGWPLGMGLGAFFFGFWINWPCLGYWAGAIPEIRLRSFADLGQKMNCTLGFRLHTSLELGTGKYLGCGNKAALRRQSFPGDMAKPQRWDPPSSVSHR